MSECEIHGEHESDECHECEWDALRAERDELRAALEAVQNDVNRAAVNNVVWPDTLRVISSALSRLIPTGKETPPSAGNAPNGKEEEADGRCPACRAYGFCDCGMVSPRAPAPAKCGFVPPTPGYAPCTRSSGHTGPCAHPFSREET